MLSCCASLSPPAKGSVLRAEHGRQQTALCLCLHDCLHDWFEPENVVSELELQQLGTTNEVCHVTVLHQFSFIQSQRFIRCLLLSFNSRVGAFGSLKENTTVRFPRKVALLVV